MRATIPLVVAAALAAAGCASPRTAPEAWPAFESSGDDGLLAQSAPAPKAKATAAPPAAPKSALDDASAAAGAGPTSPTPAPGPADPGRWRFEFTPFLWTPAIQGTVGVGELEGALDLSTSDFVDTLTDHAQNVLVLHAEARTDRFGIFGEVIYLDLEGEGERTRTFGGQQIGHVTIPTRTVTVEAETGFTYANAELGGTFRLADVDVTGDLRGTMPIDLMGGVRWYDVENSVDLTPGPDAKIEEEWYDPFVGLRFALPLGEGVALSFRGDVGGFGLGDASDLSYRLTAMLRWDFSKHVGLLAGWSLLDVDYETGSGSQYFEFDVRMSGPVAALTIWF